MIHNIYIYIYIYIWISMYGHKYEIILNFFGKHLGNDGRGCARVS